MRITFLDNSFLLALVHRDHPLHERALAWQRVIRGEFLTTEYVLVQLIDTLADEARRDLALEIAWLLRADPGVGVLPASTTLMEEGLAVLEEQPHDWTLTECISFAAMRHAGIQDVLTTNRHFEQAGFRSLLRIEPPAELDAVDSGLRAALCTAIQQHLVVRFRYHDRLRLIEPYRYGRSVVGHELLRGYQRAGQSRSGEATGWKTFRVSEISDFIVTRERFTAPQASYSGGESAMTEIYCQV